MLGPLGIQWLLLRTNSIQNREARKRGLFLIDRICLLGSLGNLFSSSEA